MRQITYTGAGPREEKPSLGCLILLLLFTLLTIVVPILFWGTIWVAVVKYITS